MTPLARQDSKLHSDHRRTVLAFVAGLAGFGGGGIANADALSSPSMTAPLSANAKPTTFDAGPLGKVYVTGAVSGLGLTQNNHAPGDSAALLDVSNGQVFIQTTAGPVQFFIEAGAYSLPSLGTPYVKAGTATRATYGALPVAYVKFQPNADFSLQIGKLPTMIGAEYPFTFQNLNIERGLLWNQEPVVSQGVQGNYSHGKITASVSLNDGFYSGHYNWLDGLFTYAFSANDSLTFVGGGALSGDKRSTFATPVAQNNGSIYNVIFSHTVGPLTLNPYVQYAQIPEVDKAGIYRAASSVSGAILAKYSFTPEISLGARVEYISTTSASCPAAAAACVQTNLLYGPKSNAYSLTLTPTYQKQLFYVRGEVSYTAAGNYTPGSVFGSTFNAKDQIRGIVETGILF